MEAINLEIGRCYEHKQGTCVYNGIIELNGNQYHKFTFKNFESIYVPESQLHKIDITTNRELTIMGKEELTDSEIIKMFI